jgi:chromosomal replication initiator protein
MEQNLGRASSPSLVCEFATPAGIAWEQELCSIKGAFDPQIYSAYVRPLKVAAYDGARGELTLSAPSKFLCNHVDRNFKEKIRAALVERVAIKDLSLKFTVDASLAESTDTRPIVVFKRPVEAAVSEGARGEWVSGLNLKYTFENFVVGRSNEFCHAAALRVAEQPGKSYNPLFIYGGVGLGKTHLLHAIGNAVLQRDPTAQVLYLSSETFTNELIQSLRHDRMDEFKKRLRGIQVLLIDDIQFMRGKERTQEEFFHTFNALYNAKRQIVISSDKVPQDIPGIEERLHTRFSWGLTADLQSPDFETRVAILKRKAAVESMALPEDVARLISERISSNVRELEGALTRLYALSSLQKTTITMELAKAALRPLLQSRRLNLSIDDIKRSVALHFSMKVSDLSCKRRTKAISFPRHIAMYLCRKHTSTSYPEIGAQFGGRDHSSVIHAANTISMKAASDPEVRNLVLEIERKLLGG